MRKLEENEVLQRDFFEREENQYGISSILNLPLHTFLEQKMLIEKLRGLRRDDFVVDFGAGSGRITIHLLQHHYAVCAVDISRKSLRNLREAAKKLSLPLVKTSESLPKNKKFQAIVGADILHHVDMHTYLPIFYSSLRKGGKVVFSEPGAFNPSWYMYLPLFASWKVEKGVINCSYKGLLGTFRKYGFTNIKITGLGLFPRPFFNWSRTLCHLNDQLGNALFLKLFAYRYIIEATKD